MTNDTSAVKSREEITVGDFVRRKKVNAFRYHQEMVGIVLKITDGRAYIRWEIKQRTGQQHSTIQLRFLELVIK